MKIKVINKIILLHLMVPCWLLIGEHSWSVEIVVILLGEIGQWHQMHSLEIGKLDWTGDNKLNGGKK